MEKHVLLKTKDNKNYILGDRMINTLDAYFFYKKNI